MLNSQGKPEPLDKEKINSIIKNVVEVMACDGLRTISVAYRDFPSSMLLQSLEFTFS